MWVSVTVLYRYWHNALLAAVARAALAVRVKAVHVQFDAMTDYLSGNIAAYGSQQLLYRGQPELLHCPAHDAYGVVVVSSFAKAVDRRTAHGVKLAEHACFQKEL